MKNRISKIALIMFVVLGVLSGFLLSVPGEYWSWYRMMAVCALVPIYFGPRRYRIWGVIGLLLSLGLICTDIQAGKRYRAMMRERLANIKAPYTNGSAEPSQGIAPDGVSHK